MAEKTWNILVSPFASTTTRIKVVVKKCVRFSAGHSTFITFKPADVDEEDIIHITTALFNNIKIKDLTEDIGKPFKFLQEWFLIRFHENLLTGTSADSSTSSTAGSMSDALSVYADYEAGNGVPYAV